MPQSRNKELKGCNLGDDGWHCFCGREGYCCFCGHTRKVVEQENEPSQDDNELIYFTKPQSIRFTTKSVWDDPNTLKRFWTNVPNQPTYSLDIETKGTWTDTVPTKEIPETLDDGSEEFEGE